MKKTQVSKLVGQGLIEFALVMPILAFLLIGLFDLGYAAFIRNILGNAAHEGARTGIVLTKQDADIQAQVRATTAGLNTATLQIQIAPSPNRTFNQPITVTVSYPYVPLTPVLGNIVGGSITLSATSVMIVEGVIEYH